MGDGLHEPDVGAGGPLVHKGGKAADEIDTDLFAGAVHCNGDGGEILSIGCGADLRDWRNRDAFVDDGDAVFALELFSGGYEHFGCACHAVVDLGCHNVDAFVRAASQIQSQRDRADVEVLFAHHRKGFAYFGWCDLHGVCPSLRKLWCCPKRSRRSATRYSIANNPSSVTEDETLSLNPPRPLCTR